jgi:hypothetical protein
MICRIGRRISRAVRSTRSILPLQAKHSSVVSFSSLPHLEPRLSFKIGLCIPDGVAVLAGLAVQETQLLERFAEDVFSAHFERVCCVFRIRGRFAVVVEN